MTVRQKIDGAYFLYDKGEWNRSLKILSEISGFAKEKPTQAELAEIVSLQGWNKWKKGEKEEAYSFWSNVAYLRPEEATAVIKASVHAGLGIYYAEKENKGIALKHAQLAQDILPEDATSYQSKNLNACGITMAKIGGLDEAEKILLKVAQINEQLMKSDDPEIAREATHQRGKNGYNLALLVYIPQGFFTKASKELDVAVCSYKKVTAETDLAAAYHRYAEVHEARADQEIEAEMKEFNLGLALKCENLSLGLWEKHSDDPKRTEVARENIKRIEAKMRE